MTHLELAKIPWCRELMARVLCGHLVAIAIAIGVWTPTVAQAPTTIDAALRTALGSSPELRAQRANVQVLEETRVQVAAGGRFSVGGALNVQEDYSAEGNIRGIDNDTAGLASIGLQANRTLYDGKRTASAVTQVDANLRASRQGVVVAEQGVLLAAAQAYLEMLRAGEILVLARGNESLLAEELAAARDRLRVGSGSRTDVAQAEARLAAAESNVAASVARQEIARADFENAIGVAPPSNLAAPSATPEIPVSLGTALDYARDSHPEVTAARAGEDAAMAGLAAAKSERGPTLNLFGRATRSFDEGQASQRQQTDVTVGLELSQSLYSGGAVESKVRAAMAEIAAQQAVRAGVERRIRHAVVAAWEGLTAARATIRSGETRVAAAELALRGVRERLAVGLGTTLDVLDAEQELLDAQVALVQARYDEFIAAFQIRAAVGTLTAEELEL